MHRSNQKGIASLIIILIVVGILVIGGGTVYYFMLNQKSNRSESNISNSNATADETASWKIFRDDRYGFEMKYPPELEISETEQEGAIYFHEIRDDGYLTSPWLSIQILSLSDSNDQQKEYGDRKTDTKKSEIIIDGKIATLYMVNPMDKAERSRKSVFIKSTDGKFVIYIDLFEETFGGDLYKNILSTLKFFK